MSRVISEQFSNASSVADKVRELRLEIPVTKTTAYLNNAATAPITTHVRDAMLAAIDERLHGGNAQLSVWRDRYDEVRALVGRLINVQPKQVAFIKNTSEGISLAANGLRWQPGDNVVLLSRDFPSNYYPWERLRERGLELRFIPQRDQRFDIDEARALIDKRTRALCVSSVRFDSGYRLDLTKFGQLCRDHDVLFFVDAIQQLGALQMDASACGASTVACGSHKWIMGPRGVGFFYISESTMDRLDTTMVGWASVQNAYEMRYELSLLDDAQRFEGGTENTAGIHGLGASLETHLAFGLENAEARVLTLNAYLRDALARTDYEVLSPGSIEERSGIIIIRNQKFDAQTIVDRLDDAQVKVVGRGVGVRVSPHYFNTEEEIDRLVAALPR